MGARHSQPGPQNSPSLNSGGLARSPRGGARQAAARALEAAPEQPRRLGQLTRRGQPRQHGG
jgi:hypothetical protein